MIKTITLLVLGVAVLGLSACSKRAETTTTTSTTTATYAK